MILGGYGNFGKRIAGSLAAKGIEVLITGRNIEKARNLAREIGPLAKPLKLDIATSIANTLDEHRPSVIVNTVGPFQGQGYQVARTAIANRAHYIDLADGRNFVGGITKLDAAARAAGVVVISGASTVPALSDAVLAEFCSEFEHIERMKYGISPGQGAERGLATTRAILTYVGKKLAPFPSIRPVVYGWQDIYRQHYPGLGSRWMANCEVPDLDLLPHRYPIETIQFSAGLELGALHLGLWSLSHLIRWGLPLSLPKFAEPLLAASNWFDRFGSRDGGMHFILSGNDANQPHRRLERRCFIIARNGDGPHIPTVPAIILAERIAGGDALLSGAYPCLGLISLSDYLAELKGLAIEMVTSRQSVSL